MIRMILVGAVLSLAFSPAQPPQKPPSPAPSPAAEAPQFGAEAEIVTVDAVVTDSHGKPIAGLTKEDFLLSEDDQAEPIDNFEAISLPEFADAVPAPLPVVSSNVPAPGSTPVKRLFVLVFDDLNLTPTTAEAAKAAVKSFLDKLREGDAVTLLTTSGSLLWSTRLEAGRDDLLELEGKLEGRHPPRPSLDTQGEMTDYEALRINIFQDQSILNQVSMRWDAYGARATGDFALTANSASLARQRAIGVYEQARQRNLATLQSLSRAIDSMALGKGRKSLILVSEGFIYDSRMNEFRTVTDAARHANVAVYFLDTRGLQGQAGAFKADTVGVIPEQILGDVAANTNTDDGGANALAADTGGYSVRNTNDLGGRVQRIVDESRTYYLLGFRPHAKDQEGKFHKIQVKVKREGARVTARKGYYTPNKNASAPKPKAGELDPALRRALDSPFLVDQIPARMSAYVLDATDAKAKTLVVTEVRLQNSGFQEKDGALATSLEVSFAATSRETATQLRNDQRIEVKLPAEAQAKGSQATWYPLLRTVDLPAGTYQAKIVVRDAKGKVGTVEHRFEVPDLSEWRVSSPILSDALQREARGTPVISPVAHREFLSGQPVYCQFQVYGAAKDKATGLPRVSSAYVVRKVKGPATSARVDLTPIKPGAEGRLSRLLGFSLEGFEAGLYELDLTVKDEVSGKVREVSEPFTVVSPGQ